MANQGLLTNLQPQGTEDYDLEKQQEEWSILEVGGCVAEVLTEKWISIAVNKDVLRFFGLLHILQFTSFLTYLYMF